jgi:hypothetical protein
MPNPLTALIDRISSVFKPSQAPPTTADANIRTTSLPEAFTDVTALFREETDRISQVNICRRMYNDDPRAKRLIGKLARDACKGGFTVAAPNNAQAEQEARDLIKRLDLENRLPDWFRLTVRDGDSFLEAGIDGERNISLVSRKPTLNMHRNSNSVDRFPDPAKAYWFAPDLYIGATPTQNSIWFAEWQVIHARWEQEEGRRYGYPLFAAGTQAYKRVREGELDIAVRRKTRAGMKYMHVVEGADAGALEQYKQNNKEALDNPFAAVADFFSNKPGSLSAVQGDAKLQEIGDVEHHIQTWLMSGIVPMELLGYGANLNRDVLNDKKDAYEEEIEAITSWVEAQLVVPLLERQWLLKDIYPDSLDYEIKWSVKQALKADVIALVADAMLKLKTLGVDPAIITAILEKFLPGIDLQLLSPSGALLAPTTGDAARLAAALTALGGAAVKPPEVLAPQPNPAPKGTGTGATAPNEED